MCPLAPCACLALSTGNGMLGRFGPDLAPNESACVPSLHGCRSGAKIGQKRSNYGTTV